MISYTVRILVFSFILLNVCAAMAQPTNNNFASPQVLTGNSGNLTGNNSGATAETGEPAHAGVTAHHSVWFRWQAVFTGRVTFAINSRNFTPVAAIYTGNSVNVLRPVASDNNPTLLEFCCTSSLVGFNAVSGTLYQIAVDGKKNSDSGSFTLRFGAGRTISGSMSTLSGGSIPESDIPRVVLTGINTNNDIIRIAAPAPRYSFAVFQGDDYRLDPQTSRGLVGFAPTVLFYRALSNDVTDANFTARTPTYVISGEITDSRGNPLSDIPIIVSGNNVASLVTTRGDGSYIVSGCVIYNDYSVTPASPINTKYSFEGLNGTTGFYPGIRNSFLNQNYRAYRLPSAQLTAPASNARFTAPATVTLTAEATAGDSPIRSVVFATYAGANEVFRFEDSTAPYSVQWNNVAAGSYTLSATVIDTQGQDTFTPDLAITVIPPLAIVSAASYLTAVATESIAAVFGSGLATGTCVANTRPLPTTLCGVTVRLRNGAGSEIPAPLFFVSPAQINYQIPPSIVAGQASVTVTTSNGAALNGVLNINLVAPGLFAANANGQGVAAAVALRVKANGAQSYEPVARFDASLNLNVAVPIDFGPATDQVYLILFGTGWRFRSALSAVALKVGGLDAPVSYAGAQSLVGLDQINALLPRGLMNRGEVDVVLMVDGKPANTVKVTIK